MAVDRAAPTWESVAGIFQSTAEESGAGLGMRPAALRFRQAVNAAMGALSEEGHQNLKLYEPAASAIPVDPESADDFLLVASLGQALPDSDMNL